MRRPATWGTHGGSRLGVWFASAVASASVAATATGSSTSTVGAELSSVGGAGAGLAAGSAGAGAAAGRGRGCSLFARPLGNDDLGRRSCCGGASGCGALQQATGDPGLLGNSLDLVFHRSVQTRDVGDEGQPVVLRQVVITRHDRPGAIDPGIGEWSRRKALEPASSRFAACIRSGPTRAVPSSAGISWA